MRFLIFVFFSSFNYTYCQVQLVIETNFSHKLSRYLFSTQSNLRGEFYFINEKVFLLNDGVTLINEETKELEPIIKQSEGDIVSHLIGVNDELYCAVNKGSNNGTFKLLKIDNELETHEYYSHEYDMFINLSSQGFFFQQVGNSIFFYIEDSQKKRFYKFNTETKITEEIINYHRNHQILTHATDNRGVLFSRIINESRDLNYIDETGDIHTLFPNNETIKSVSWIENNDSTNFYVSLRYENNVDSIFRINYETLERSLFSTRFVSSLHFKSNNRILGSYGQSTFLANVTDDTLQITHRPVQLTAQYRTDLYSYYLNLLDAEKELFTNTTIEHGLELFKITNEDSLDLIKDLNQGISHSIPFGHCDQITRLQNGILRHEGEVYFNMTNGNDNDVYLYKISKDSLEPVLRLKDFNINIRYFTSKEHFYYFVYNSEVNKIRLYKIKWSDMNDTQSPEIKFDSPTWATETSFKIKNDVCYHTGWTNITPIDIIADNNNNTYIQSAAINSYGESWLFERKNKKEISTNLCNAYHKYDEYGQLKWMKTIGGTYKSGFTMYDKFAMDDDNNLQVYGVFFKKAYFDNDSLETVGSARFYAKIHGETGEVIDKKTLYETDYTNNTIFEKLIKGDENYFYLVGNYRDFKQNFGDTTLISNWNYQNFLAKYDENGNLIWIRNILNNWDDVIGEINNIEYSEANNEIMVFCSQNKTWCNDGSWRGEIIFYDTNGKEKIRKNLEGWNRHTIGQATALNSQYYLVKGSIKASLKAGVYKTNIEESASYEDCNDTYDYQIIYDRQQNKFISAVISDSLNGMNIKRVFQDKNYIYYCGNRVNGRNIVIQRFDKEGNYRGEKVLNQREDINIVDFAYRDGYFVLIMRDAKKDSFLNVDPIFNDVANVMSVIRFEIKDWDYLQSYKQMNVEFIEEGLALFAYPNPTYGTIQINYTSDNIKFETYKILSYSGQQIFEDKVPNQNSLTIDLSHYQNGLYFIQFEGHGEREVIKVIKQP
jgi:hypothetical protein